MYPLHFAKSFENMFLSIETNCVDEAIFRQFSQSLEWVGAVNEFL
jgi:hypothetical protein